MGDPRRLVAGALHRRRRSRVRGADPPARRRRTSPVRRRVLDVGCGEGQLARRVAARRRRSVVGIDPTEAQIVEAAARGGGVTYARGAARSTCPSPPGSFDAVVICLTLEHLEPFEPAVDEVGRVLAPGGRFVCFLNHPLLQAPGSGWIDDHILEEQYWRVGPYLPDDVAIEEVAPGIRLPFMHRPLEPIHQRDGRLRAPGRAHGRAAPAAGLPGPGTRVRRGGDDPPTPRPARPQARVTRHGAAARGAVAPVGPEHRRPRRRRALARSSLRGDRPARRSTACCRSPTTRTRSSAPTPAARSRPSARWTQRGDLDPDLGYWAERFDPNGVAHPIALNYHIGDQWVNVTTLPMIYAAVPLYDARWPARRSCSSRCSARCLRALARALARRLADWTRRRRAGSRSGPSGSRRPSRSTRSTSGSTRIGLAAMLWGVVALLDVARRHGRRRSRRCERLCRLAHGDARRCGLRGRGDDAHRGARVRRGGLRRRRHRPARRPPTRRAPESLLAPPSGSRSRSVSTICSSGPCSGRGCARHAHREPSRTGPATPRTEPVTPLRTTVGLNHFGPPAVDWLLGALIVALVAYGMYVLLRAGGPRPARMGRVRGCGAALRPALRERARLRARDAGCIAAGGRGSRRGAGPPMVDAASAGRRRDRDRGASARVALPVPRRRQPAVGRPVHPVQRGAARRARCRRPRCLRPTRRSCRRWSPRCS